MAEAAEARLRAQEGRGVKDPGVVRERQRKAMELERLEQQSAGTQREGGLRVSLFNTLTLLCGMS